MTLQDASNFHIIGNLHCHCILYESVWTEQKFMCWFNLQLCISRRLLMNSLTTCLMTTIHGRWQCSYLYPKCRWMERLSFYCYLVLFVLSFLFPFNVDYHSIHALIFVHAFTVYPKMRDSSADAWCFYNF